MKGSGSINISITSFPDSSERQIFTAAYVQNANDTGERRGTRFKRPPDECNGNVKNINAARAGRRARAGGNFTRRRRA
ncbi:hypothetical protein EVAR_14324_1 [Eumeta japonica]|uniref:Uncharacterized protein n=1 Tax=Eumeta variegata TaxID=151549 RepID=A0A4C1UM08_EUMVA|nr:hypothetical protein EVAR_14324_1 [Eumeta japonica]